MTSDQLLQFIPLNDILTESEIEKYIIMNKKKKVQGIHHTPFYTRSDGRYFTKVNENGGLKQLIAPSEDELYNKLFEFYFGDKNTALEDLCPQWIKWRDEETSVTKKTIKENMFLWNAFLKNSKLAKVPMKLLKPIDYIKFFRSITKNRTLTRKRFNDIKSVMNGIVYYAIEQEILEHNHLRDINYRQFTYKVENNNVLPYTEEERKRIINHLKNDLYSLGIKLDFHMVIRIGELRSLKWSDVGDDFIYIHSFMNEKNAIIEGVKGHTTEGNRNIPLTDTSKCLLTEIKRVNPDSEYLFICNGKPLVTVTFNRRIAKCCFELGIKYRSSHKIRFSTASIMYKNGVTDTELQELLGHTTLNMTRHYLRNLTPSTETQYKMNSILG